MKINKTISNPNLDIQLSDEGKELIRLERERYQQRYEKRQRNMKRLVKLVDLILSIVVSVVMTLIMMKLFP